VKRGHVPMFRAAQACAEKGAWGTSRPGCGRTRSDGEDQYFRADRVMACLYMFI
jgi:hypothetical protein